MKILIGCEYSGRVRRAFREMGHDAYSCDLIESEDDSEYHIVGDVRRVMRDYYWDMMVAFPPCQFLSRAGARWLYPGGMLNSIRYEKREVGLPGFKTYCNGRI